MRNSLRIGKIFGIEIGLDYSWFLVFVLITWSLSAHYFPTHYQWRPVTYWLVGMTTSLLFFGSILAHELSHSLVAMNKDVRVQSIKLFIFGGVAQITKEPERPRDEFQIAIAGPLVSGGVGILCFGIESLTRGLSEPITALASWLGTINLTVGIFNLIPGFPLDGGRILRSAVWRLTGSFKKATKAASTSGRVFAYGLMAFGIWLIFNGLWASGIWLGFIGMFLENAASSYYKQVALEEQLSGVKARDVMVTDCASVPPDLTIQALVQDHIFKSSGRCFPISENGRMLGIVTLHNIKGISRQQWPVTPVSQAMIPFERLKSVSPDRDMFKVMKLMAEENINQVPVIEGGCLIGMISRDRLLEFLATREELAA